MLKEFKEFALKGNAIQLAIGVVIANALQTIIKALVNDIIMPLISILTGKVDFEEWIWVIDNTSIPYGSFISSVINFILSTFILFLIIRYFNKLNNTLEKATAENAKKFEKLTKKNKFLNKFYKKESKIIEEPSTKICNYCYTEININATRCPHCTSELTEKEKI